MVIERNVVLWLVLAIFLALFIHILSPVLLPFAAGLILAYFVNPLVDALGRLGLPRWASTIFILVGTIAIFTIAVIFLVPLLVQQASAFAAALPGELERLRQLVDDAARSHFGDSYPAVQNAVNNTMSDIANSLPNIVTGIASSVWNQGAAAFSFVSLVLVTPLVFFYALLDWPRLLRQVDSWLPRQNATEIRAVAFEVDERVSAFIRGQGIVCIILAAFYGTLLSLVGLKYGLFVGVVTGLLAFVPFAGWALGLIIGTSLAVVQFWPDMLQVLKVPAVLLAGQALDAALLAPKIVGSKVGLHPVWLIFALLTFSYLFGFLGMLIAVPVAAAIGVLVRFALKKYIGSSMYQGAPKTTTEL